MGRLYLTREASLSAITNRTAQFSEQDAAKLVYPAAERARHTHTHVATEVAEGMKLEIARIAKYPGSGLSLHSFILLNG